MCETVRKGFVGTYDVALRVTGTALFGSFLPPYIAQSTIEVLLRTPFRTLSISRNPLCPGPAPMSVSDLPNRN
jgi:hypothetical protein